jgi:hypothetical protein
MGKNKMRNGVKYLPWLPTEIFAPFPNTIGVHCRYMTVTVASTCIGNNNEETVAKSLVKKYSSLDKNTRNNMQIFTKISHNGSWIVKFPK